MDPALRQLVDAATALTFPPLPSPWPEPGEAEADWVATVGAQRAVWEQLVHEAAARGDYDKPLLPGVAHSREVRIPVTGGAIPARISTPDGAGPHPAVLMFHGGGFWIGGGIGLAAAEADCQALCVATGAVVVNVDYRQAPEHRFPVALEDCYAATVWVVDHAVELEVDPDRIGVSGASAGGNLAAAVSLAARERGTPQICFQQLLVPATDATLGSPSVTTVGIGTDLSAETIGLAWDYYAGRTGDRTDPLMSPLLAADLTGLPPAQVIVGEHDPIRDDGLRYAERLRAAGVPTAVSRLDMTHGIATPEVAAAYLAEVVDGLRQGLRVVEGERAATPV